MKKFFSVMMLVLVALLVFTGCEKFTCSDSHKVSELAGTWTCFQENFAEALVIKANGSVLSTGYDGEYWEDIKGNISIQDGKISMIFEDDDNTEGHFDFIPGIAFSITSDKGERYTYNYCKDDFSDEIVGMWVCNDATNGTTSQMAINSYMEDGTNVFTGVVPNTDSSFVIFSVNGVNIINYANGVNLIGNGSYFKEGINNEDCFVRFNDHYYAYVLIKENAYDVVF